jgi:hypothetical protein
MEHATAVLRFMGTRESANEEEINHERMRSFFIMDLDLDKADVGIEVQ